MKEGVVVKATGSLYTVRTNEKETIPCRLKGRMRLEDQKSTSPVVVGDNVLFEYEPDSGTGVVAEVLPRKNHIVRKSTNLSKQSHVLAANIDQAILLITINYPVTTTVFIDRFLVSAEAFSIPSILVFNKVDRYKKGDLEHLSELMAIYGRIGYRCETISALNDDDIDKIKSIVKDKVSLIAGHSGVGKSTLVNRLEPSVNLKTAEISSAHKTGIHTTTFAEMHTFSFGGYVIDTPGIRGFGLIDTGKEELYHYFREIFEASAGCQFNNCTHVHEPDCAVKAAVDEGQISVSRYNSYLSIYLNKDEKYR